MALISLESNLRNYNPKFSDFGVNQVVAQPIPAEPSRTAPSNLDRRQDDFRRLASFLTSGKGLTFAAKQAGLDQAARGTSEKERAREAANTAARLTNITLQAGPPGEIVRFSSHPFLRYIEARGLVGQRGSLFGKDAPSLANRGRTIIPDNEWVNNAIQASTVSKNIDRDSTSLKSTSEGSKFSKTVSEGYVVDPNSVSTRERVKAESNIITDQSIRYTFDDNISQSQRTNLNPKYVDLIKTNGFNATNTIRTRAKIRAGRNENGRFGAKVPYIDNLGDLSDSKNENNNIELKFDPYTARYAGLIKPIKFTATLDDFSDTYNSNWNSTQYIGRGEPVYNFTSTSRTIGFSFKAYSTSAGKVRDLYKRLNQLASYTNPTYTDTFMAGTFIKLTLGDYLVATPGFLTSVDFKWQTSYPWEVTGTEKSIINSEIYQISDIPKLPHILDVSIGFTPIHNFIPEANPNTVNRAFIATNDKVMSYADRVMSLDRNIRPFGVAATTPTDDIPEVDPLVFIDLDTQLLYEGRSIDSINLIDSTNRFGSNRLMQFGNPQLTTPSSNG